MKLVFIEGYVHDEKYWNTLGWIVMILTCGLSIMFWYERFFERVLFLNRRTLGDYIDEVGFIKKHYDFSKFLTPKEKEE